MRAVIIGLVALGLVGHVSFAQAQSIRCSAAVRALEDQWRAIAYPTPSKPMQAIVTGRGGHRNSGPEIRYMITQMRLARAECAEGRNAEALARIDEVKRLLRTSKDEQGGL